ncbi:protease HtpX [Colwelliaceae bacterium 6471]
MKRIILFLTTNLAIILLLGTTLRLLGFESIMDEQGVDLDLNSLLVFALVLGFGGSFISLMLSKWLAKRMTSALVIVEPANEKEHWLLTTVARQAKMAAIGMPEVAIYQASDMNAFATGMSRNNALVAVSSGLLQGMTKDEIEGVLAHEISHVANGDMVTLTLIQGVVNTFVIFMARVVGHIVDRVIFKNERGHGPAFWVTTIVAELLLGILASMVVFWFSRQREFGADEGGAKLAGRNKMLQALEKLKAHYQPSQLPEQMAAFGINGGVGSGFKKLFMSHPPIDERIDVLKRFA